MKNSQYALPVFFCLLQTIFFSTTWSVFAQAEKEGKGENFFQKGREAYSQGSYAKAKKLFQSIPVEQLSGEEKVWLRFEIANASWRSQAATNQSDASALEEAKSELELLAQELDSQRPRPRLWVEVQESLGDYYWLNQRNRQWHQAWPFYQKALQWWAKSYELKLAREKYLGIVFKASSPRDQSGRHYQYGYYGNMLPLEVIKGAVRIAQQPNEHAQANYLMAMFLKRNRSRHLHQHSQMTKAFEKGLKLSKGTEWRDDLLYNYAEMLEHHGKFENVNGSKRYQADYKKALVFYRKLLSEFRKGESAYYDRAKNKIKTITEENLSVYVSNVFLPGAKVKFQLNWRNISQVDVALYEVDLTEDFSFPQGSESETELWLENLRFSLKDRVQHWQEEAAKEKNHYPGSRTIKVKEKLLPGAYVIQVKGKNETARELILVTNTTVAVKTAKKRAIVFCCDALTGAPVPGAKIVMWEEIEKSNESFYTKQVKTANAEGLVEFVLKRGKDNNDHRLLVTSRVEHNGLVHQALVSVDDYIYEPAYQQWKIYAYTDRPAYRPGETVHWKFTGRVEGQEGYSTPAGEQIKVRIHGPRGNEAQKVDKTLNTFGSAWGELELTSEMALGSYRISFYDQKGNAIGNAELFRLEEYKLPEFKVSVSTAKENGKPKVFRLGEEVEVEIEAEYFFGGAVSEAQVEFVVYQRPYYKQWYWPREYPWLYQSNRRDRSYYYGGRGQIVKQEKIKTNEEGKAKFTIATPMQMNSDLEYEIEARVTDASRREITGRGRVKVTKSPYFIYAKAKHNLYRPQDKVEIEFKAIDANEEPVQAVGTVKLTRDYWTEIWIDPSGKEVTGEELRALKKKSVVFPPLPSPPSHSRWKLKYRGYHHDEIRSETLKTNEEGKVFFSFQPEREGYYRAQWTGNEKEGVPVTTQTTVWVRKDGTTELGYRSGELELILDRDTFQMGEKAPLMISVMSPDRYVLLAVQSNDLIDYQLVHVKGHVKFLELDIDERHVPNFFLEGTMVYDARLFQDVENVIVPPKEKFLDIEIKTAKTNYTPREKGALEVWVKDSKGNPVEAELSLAQVDASVFSIQKELAQDPRQFYYGQLKGNRLGFYAPMTVKPHRKKDKTHVGVELKGNVDTGYVYGDRFDGLRKNEWGAKQSVDMFGARERPASAQVASRSRRSRSKLRSELREMDSEGMGIETNRIIPSEESGTIGDVEVRSDFRSTMLWQPDLKTDANGYAKVEVTYPDSLTTWKAKARAVTVASQFGQGISETKTNKELITRLQAPRFFVVGDQVTLSAVVNNNSDRTLSVKNVLETGKNKESGKSQIGKIEIKGVLKNGKIQRGNTSVISIPAGEEARIDWVVEVKKAGIVPCAVAAQAGKVSDAMRRTYQVYEHGIDKLIVESGKLTGEDNQITIEIPQARRKESTQLEVQLAPSMAITMLDALPYLIRYPYGCTEQTMSRFLPAVVVSKTLKEMKVNPSQIEGRLFGGIEKEHIAKTHSQNNNRGKYSQLGEITRKGLKRLYDFQRSDGGWGWWKEGDSDHFMTAYVVWGFAEARAAGISVNGTVWNRGMSYLEKEIVEEENNYDTQAWMLHALASNKRKSKYANQAFQNLWKNKDKLNAYTRALLALSAHYYGKKKEALQLVENLENGVKRDEQPDISIIQRGKQNSGEHVMGTAHWGEDGIYYRWSQGGIEATAFCLSALVQIDPDNSLIEPVSNWLIKNRRGSNWSNTRDTAMTILALNHYLKKSDELKSDLEYELSVNGHVVAQKTIKGRELLTAPSRFQVKPEWIQDGTNQIVVRKKGKGPLYFSANASFFSLEEPIPAAGNEIFVRRQYYRIQPKPTLLEGVAYEKVPLNDGDVIKSGERIETVLQIECKNNYEYLLFEDLKPAGFEATQIKSGIPLYTKELKSVAVKNQKEGKIDETLKHKTVHRENKDYTGRSRWVYQELRDRKVALFIDKLPEGFWEIRYEMRAEVPGKFHALPVMGHAMYIPEIKCNGNEIRVTVLDQ